MPRHRSVVLSSLILPAALGLALSACGPPDVEFDCDDPVGSGWDPAYGDPEIEFLQLTNEVREGGATCNGVFIEPVPPVTLNEQLRCAARWHALNMAVNDFFDHDSPAGTSVVDRVEFAEYRWARVSENLSAGDDTPAGALAGLVASTSGHCENIMDLNVSELGVGARGGTEDSTYSHYWVQVFAAPQ